MDVSNGLFESNYKKLGFSHIDKDDLEMANGAFFQPYIKVLHIPKGYELTIDFKPYKTVKPTLFFVNSNQVLHFGKIGKDAAEIIYYNRDFYCVQIHDAEVACDGLLFNNLFQIPIVDLDKEEAVIVAGLLQQIQGELLLKDNTSEEMIRIYLKQIIIRATRTWKKQNLQNDYVQVVASELDFFRNFSRLVEIHFREKHSVADYAALLFLAPKTLSSKFNKLRLEHPNEIIKNRIVLEAKRLLMYTELSVKEIGYQLGYDDPAYFNRLFTQKAKLSPATFRKENKN